MSDNDMMEKLERYKAKLDRGEELTPEEKAELEAIGKHIAEVLDRFVKALQEAFAPIIEALAKAVKEVWESIPEDIRKELQQQAAPPLKFNLGEGVTPYSVPQNLMDSEERRVGHYRGRGGW